MGAVNGTCPPDKIKKGASINRLDLLDAPVMAQGAVSRRVRIARTGLRRSRV